MYTTFDDKFIVFPCSGLKLNNERLQAPATSLDESDSLKFDSLIINSSFFNEVVRFTNITKNDKAAKNYLKEYFYEFELCNSHKNIYMHRNPIQIPLIKSIHSQLSRTLDIQRL